MVTNQEMKKFKPLTKCQRPPVIFGYSQLLKQVLSKSGKTWGQLERAHQEKCTIYFGTSTHWSIWCHQKKRNYHCWHTQILWPQKFSHCVNRCMLERSCCSTSPRKPPNRLSYQQKCPATLKKICGNWTWVSCKSHLKMYFSRVWYKPHQGSSTY